MPTGIFPRRVNRHAVIQPLDQSYRIIPLTRGQNALVDSTDYKWLMQWHWRAAWNSHTKSFYAGRGFRIGEKQKTISMHRTILGCSEREFVDHINHDTLDNRRENLRAATPHQSSFNRQKHADNRSGFKGIRKNWNKWQAVIVIGRKTLCLGSFESKLEAADAYDEAAKKFHREFASLNFPPSEDEL